MEDFIPLSYKHVFSGNRPSLETLLAGIPTKPLLYCLCKINFELYFEPSNGDIQFQLLDYWLKGIDERGKAYINYKISAYIESHKERALFFGKRYILEFFNYLFENYNDLPERKLLPAEISNTFIAYLVITEQCNEKDKTLFPGDETKKSQEELEEASWPFLMNQFECNHTPVHETEILKLFTAIVFIQKEPVFKKYLDEYMVINGFTTIGHLVNSAIAVISNQKDNYDNNTFHNRYPILYATKKADRLENLSLDYQYFQKHISDNIYYKLLKDRPLIKLHDNDYSIIDFAFLKGKIYTGFLFDLYYKTSFKEDAAYPKFDKFKSQISKHVVEENIFTKLLRHILINEGVVSYFEKNESISIPDCYFRVGSKIFFLEFKDYLLRGDIFQSYSYKDIKNAIDAKFVAGKSGIPQIKEQLSNLIKKKFTFDSDLDYDGNLTIYPIIVHTNFALSCPGIQQYLNRQLMALLPRGTIPENIKLKELTLIDLNVFLLHFYNLKEQNNLLGDLIERYLANGKKRTDAFNKNGNLDPISYSEAFQSFDMDYFSAFKKEAIPHQLGFLKILENITGISQEIMNYPKTDEV